MKIIELKGGTAKCRVCGVRFGSRPGGKRPRIFRILFLDGRENTDITFMKGHVFHLCLDHLRDLAKLIDDADFGLMNPGLS